MNEDDLLFSIIIKRCKTKSGDSAIVTIPITAIQLSKSNFFEVCAYSNRIEIIPHQFKFSSKKRNATDASKKETLSELKTRSSKIETPAEESNETKSEENHHIEKEDGNKKSILDQLDQDMIDQLDQS